MPNISDRPNGLLNWALLNGSTNFSFSANHTSSQLNIGKYFQLVDKMSIWKNDPAPILLLTYLINKLQLFRTNFTGLVTLAWSDISVNDISAKWQFYILLLAPGVCPCTVWHTLGANAIEGARHLWVVGMPCSVRAPFKGRRAGYRCWQV
jgi:hypothetical protein